MAFRFTLPELPTFSGPPSDSIFSTSEGFSGADFNMLKGIPMRKPQSDLQTIQALLAKSRSKSHHGFLDKLKSAGGDLASGVLNILSRPNWAVAGAFDRGLKGGSWVKGFEQGLEGKTHTTFGEVLDHQGILKGHKWLRAGAGLALDIGLDPTTYLFGAGVYGKAGKFGLKVGLHDAEKLGAAAVGTGDFAKAARAVGSKTTEKDLLGKLARGERPLTHMSQAELRGDSGALNMLERAADAEYKFDKNKYLELRFGITKGKSIGVQTPIRLSRSKAVKLARTGKAAAVTSGIARVFQPGYDNPIAHALEITGRHQTERLHQDLWNVAKQNLEPFAKSMSDDDMRKALFAGEVEGTVGKNGLRKTKIMEELGKRSIHGDKAEEAYKFLEAWHETTQHIARVEEALGAKIKGKITDRIYVPHLVDRNAPGKPATYSHIAEKGHQQLRHGDMTFEKQIALAGQRGFKGPVETNPIALLATRIRAGAQGAASGNLRRVVAEATGQPERVFMPHLRGKAFAKVDHRKRQLREVEQALEKAPSALKGARSKLGKQHAQEARDFEAKSASLKAEVTKLKSKYTKAGKNATSKTARANIKRQLNAAEKRLAKHLDSREQLAAKHLEDKHTLGLTHAEMVRDMELKKQALEKAITKLTPAARKRMYQKNPEAFKDALIHVAKMDRVVKHADGTEVRVKVRIPVELADSIDRVTHILADDKATEALTRAVGRMTSEWKMLVTTVNPGYRIRNTMSDFWNMYIAGVPPWAITKYGKQAAQLMHKAAGHSGTKAQQLEAKRILLQAHDHGVLSGLFLGDVQVQAKTLKGQQSLYRRATQATVRGNATAENWGRLTHYLYRTRREGMHPTAAAHQVRKAHFDYEDLTETERRLFKSYIPFYTWTRKNVPYQLEQILSRPGRVATFNKVAQESEYASGVQSGEVIGNALDNMPLAFKFGSGYVNPQIGLADLFRVEDPKQLASMLTPGIQLPLELALGQNFFTGQPLRGGTHELTPTNRFFGGIADLLGQGGTTSRFVPGKGTVYGPGMSPTMDLITGQVPFLSFLKKKGNPIKNAQTSEVFGGLGSEADLSYLGGVSYKKIDQKAQKYYARLEMADWLRAQIQKLRDQGDLPPAEKRKLSDFELMIAEIAYKDAGRD